VQNGVYTEGSLFSFNNKFKKYKTKSLMQKSNLNHTITVLAILILAKITVAQPVAPPFAFEDDYFGKPDIVMKNANVKVKKTYYKLSGEEQPSRLYHVHEYNQNGFLISQKWYNLLSGKEMYSANYAYDNENYFTSCIEKMTSEYDDIDYHARHLLNNGYFMPNEAGDALGAPIPMDKDSNYYVKTIYTRDSLGGYLATKYFFNDSLYKEKDCPFWNYSPFPYSNFYIEKDKSMNFSFSEFYYVADTLYASKDTLNIRLRGRINGKDCFKILKIKEKHSDFFIDEIDILFDKMKVHFSYRNWGIVNNGLLKIRKEIERITYLNYASNNPLLLIQKFEDLDSLGANLKNRIELPKVDKKYFVRAGGCLYYTKIQDGNFISEEQNLIGKDKVKKFRDIKFTHHNLVSEKICYSDYYILEPVSKAINYDTNGYIKEINVYDYF
jgi:hypothetical protein